MTVLNIVPNLMTLQIQSRIEAVIIKVAAAGLYPRKHLGKSIEYIEPELHRLRELYGINVCGEGGEYETLTLDCPLFKRGHIVLDEFEVEVGSPDSLAPVAWLKPVAFHVEMKEELDESDLDPVIYRVPDSFDPRAEGTYIAAHDAAAVHADTDVQADFSFEIGMCRSTKYITFCGECSLREEYTSSTDSLEQLTQERVGVALSELLSRMLLQVDKVGHSLSDSVFVTLYISDMTHFKYLNNVYSEFFPPVNPPSRATIQLANNGRLVVVVEIMCRKQASSSVPKKVLHVQSISSWAPCCIGPYSQGTSYDGLVHFAGQIPLDPITMELIEGDEFQQVDRVLKTCNAVAVGMGVDFDSSLLWSLLYICTEKGDSSDGSKASKILKRIKDHAGEESKNMNSDEFLEEYLKSKKLEHAKNEWSPLCLVLQFPALPRNSMLELQTVHASVESIMYEPPNDSSSSSSEEDQLCDSLGWLSDLKASSLILDESFEVHIESLHSKRQFLKCHLLLNNADLENWKDNDAAALVSLISTELKRAGLSNDSVVFIKLYIHYNGSHLRHALGLSVKSHLQSIAHACTVPVTGIWNNVLAQDCQESAVLCIEIYAKS